MIIDGYNLMGVAGGGALDPAGDLETSRELLLRRLRALKLMRSLRVTVVFDAAGSRLDQESRSGLKVVFAGGKGRADAAILGMVRANPQGVVVATSDRALGESCRQAGAAVLSSKELWSRLKSWESVGFDGMAKAKDDWDKEHPLKGSSKKKGPSRRPSKKERSQARRLRKV